MSAVRSVGRAVALGVAWGVAWAPVAVLIGVLVIDPDDSMDEMWVVVGAYPGFISGVLFYALLGLMERGRRLDSLPLPRAALLGALAALPVGLIPFLIGDATDAVPLWQLAGGWIGFLAAMSALSAVA